jgi:Flp pilus assembly pilin Flp
MLRDRKGQGTIEYTLMLSLLGIVLYSAVGTQNITHTVSMIWGALVSTFPGGNSASGNPGGAGSGSGSNSGGTGTSVGSGVSGGGGGVAGGASNGYQESASFATEEKPNEISTDSESQEHATKLWPTRAVMLLILLSLIVVVGLCLRRLRSMSNSEVSFQGLRTDQIVGKIQSKN